MKKAFLSAALALAVASSWAFYPKAEGPTGYMMVISSCAYKQSSIITVAPDGKSEQTPMSFKGLTDNDVSIGLVAIQKATLLKLNSLAADGWQLVNTSNTTSISGGGFNVAQTVYLLEKKH